MEVLTLDLATFPAGASQVVVEAQPDQIGLDAEVWTGPVRGRLRVEKSGDQVTVRGELEAVAHLECVRCLDPVDMTVRAPFQVFAERPSGRHEDYEEELERDDYMMFHDGRRLDLREQARETLLLEVPMAPRCRPDCQGLCPRCGANLNLGPCGCAPPAV
jgi:uncharacterized protein